MDDTHYYCNNGTSIPALSNYNFFIWNCEGYSRVTGGNGMDWVIGFTKANPSTPVVISNTRVGYADISSYKWIIVKSVPSNAYILS